MDVVLALDSSDSIGPNNYNLLLDFGKELARSLNVGESKTRIGFNTYATDAKVRIQVSCLKYFSCYVTSIWEEMYWVSGISVDYRE